MIIVVKNDEGFNPYTLFEQPWSSSTSSGAGHPAAKVANRKTAILKKTFVASTPPAATLSHKNPGVSEACHSPNEMQGIVSSVPLLRRRRGGVCRSGVSSMASTVDERRLLGLPGAVVVGSSLAGAAAAIVLRRALVLQLTESYSLAARTAAAYWIRFRRAVNSACLAEPRTDA